MPKAANLLWLGAGVLVGMFVVPKLRSMIGR